MFSYYWVSLVVVVIFNPEIVNADGAACVVEGVGVNQGRRATAPNTGEGLAGLILE